MTKIMMMIDNFRATMQRLIVVVSVAAWLAPAWGGPALGKGFVDLKSVIADAQKRRPGKFLEAELEERNGVHIYEIEILGPDNVIYKLKFLAATGVFIGEELD